MEKVTLDYLINKKDTNKQMPYLLGDYNNNRLPKKSMIASYVTCSFFLIHFFLHREV